MRIFVCIRVVPKSAQVNFSRSQGAIDDAEAEREISAGDRSALALARTIAQEIKGGGWAGDGAEVVAVSWARASDEPVLRQALAAGAIRLQRIEAYPTAEVDPIGSDRVEAGPVEPNPLGPDPLVTARLLSGVLRDQRPDLVLFGEESSDHGRAAVGPMVAELLGLPFVGPVKSLKIENGRALVEVWTGDRLASLSAALPLAVGVAPEAAAPAKPSPMAMMKAFKAPVEVFPSESPPPTIVVRGHSSNEGRRRANEVLEAPSIEGALEILTAKLRERRMI